MNFPKQFIYTLASVLRFIKTEKQKQQQNKTKTNEATKNEILLHPFNNKMHKYEKSSKHIKEPNCTLTWGSDDQKQLSSVDSTRTYASQDFMIANGSAIDLKYVNYCDCLYWPDEKELERWGWRNWEQLSSADVRRTAALDYGPKSVKSLHETVCCLRAQWKYLTPTYDDKISNHYDQRKCSTLRLHITKSCFHQ